MCDPLTINDLRVFGGEWPHFRKPTPAEFADIARREGWVKRSDLVEMKWCTTHDQPADGPTEESCRLIGTAPRMFMYVGVAPLDDDD